MKAKKPVCLIIMDGIGMPKDLSVSAVLPENTVFLQSLAKNYSCGTLGASGLAVGLPDDQFGTSEVGHATIGAGRVNYQSIVKINNDIKNGEFAKKQPFLKAFENAKQNGKALHLMGIVSDGGVHSHIDHLKELIKMASNNGVANIYVHFIADGRDTPPQSAINYLEDLKETLTKYNAKIATICGRFYALDRDKNWDRVKVFYDAVVGGVGAKSTNAKQALDSAYKNGEKDEFIKPIIVDKSGLIKNGDSLIMFNFRTDRARQTARVFSNDNDFEWTKKLNLNLVTMTNYDDTLKGVSVVYDNDIPTNILSEVLSARGYKQFKIAETEKYAHLTFFFNSGKNEPFENEKQVLVDSVKLQTYDAKPEMSAKTIAEKAVEAINKKEYDFVAINFANGDMVGHSGNLEATKIAVGVVDECVKKVCDAVLENGGYCIITADHGNADSMKYPNGEPNKSHTMSIVPVIIAGKNLSKTAEISGTLADIAPTILKLLGEKAPKEMTGKPLI